MSRKQGLLTPRTSRNTLVVRGVSISKIIINKEAECYHGAHMTQAELTKELREAIKETQTSLHAYERAMQALEDLLKEKEVKSKIKKLK